MLSRVGIYDVLGQVAEAPDGGLWQGHDSGLDRFVAIKHVTDPASAAAQRLRSEARLLAGISHPHIVAVYELIENTDGVWLIEEWVNGHTLSAVATNAGKLTPPQAVGVVREALQGLAHAHSLGIVHGDVTPANVLIDDTGTSKLIDFGLARTAGESVTTGSGTPGFISPQLTQGHPAAPTDDVYAAGALLVALLTKRPAFAGTTPGAVLVAQLDARPDLTGIPGHTRNVLFNALHPDPGQRYPAAAEFLAALESAALRDLGPGWLTEAGLAALVTAVGVGAATSIVGVAATPPAAQPIAASPARRRRRGARAGQAGGRLATHTSLKGVVAAATAVVITTVSAAALSVGLARHEAAAAGAISGTRVAQLAAANNPHVAAPIPSLGGGAGAARLSSASATPSADSPRQGITAAATTPGSAHATATTPKHTEAESVPASSSPAPPLGNAKAPTATVKITNSPTAAASIAGIAAASVVPTQPPTSAPAPGTLTGALGSNLYSTDDPFPGCDRAFDALAPWTLNGITDETAGPCTPGGTPVSSTDGTYGFATYSAWAKGPTMTASNTVAVTGTLPGLPSDHQRVLGVAEANGSVGYFLGLRNDGSWHLDPISGLGTASATLQPALASGQLPNVLGTEDLISMTVGPTGITVTVGPANNAGARITQLVAAAPFTPTVVGYGVGTGDPVAPLDAADFYTTVDLFSYTNNQ